MEFNYFDRKDFFIFSLFFSELVFFLLLVSPGLILIVFFWFAETWFANTEMGIGVEGRERIQSSKLTYNFNVHLISPCVLG